MSVRWMWIIVAAIWIALSLMLNFGSHAMAVGVVACALFSRFGFLAGRHGIQR